MVRCLFFKMLRDMKRSGMTYGLCIFIVAVGFCGYSVLALASRDLFRSREEFMRETRFPEVFAEVDRAPLSVFRRLEQIPGVARADGRLVKKVRVHRFGAAGDAAKRVSRDAGTDVKLLMVSVTEGGLNTPLLTKGRLPESGKRELVLGDGMALARDLGPGGELEAVIGGSRVAFTVTGTGSTPENIYMLENISDLFPVPEQYDAAFVDYRTMARILSMEGLANSFELLLEPGVSLEQIREELEELLAPYGCTSVYDRSGELSTAMLQSELEQLERMTGVLPFLFLTVAAVVLFISLGRLMEQQRTQIGMLMALGFTSGEIQVHYGLYGAVIGLTGGFLGGMAGYGCSGPMAGFYREYFRLPPSGAGVDIRYLFTGTVMACLFCGAVSFLAAGRLAKLSPSAALRPEAPRKARRLILERIPGFTGLFTEAGLVAVRSLARNRRKTVMSVFGIAFAFMITATLVSLNSMYDIFIFDYWEDTQRQDLTVRFDGYVREKEAVRAVRVAGLDSAEGILEIPVTLKSAEGEIDGMIEGIEENSSLRLLYAEDGRAVRPGHGEILLSRHTADLLGVEAGDEIRTVFMYPEKTDCQVRVGAVITQYMGDTSYMDRETAGKLTGLGDACSTVILRASGRGQDEIRKRLKDAKRVAFVESCAERVDGLRVLTGSLSGMMEAMAAMGVVISSAVFYIISLVSFEERKRELSVLLTLGVTARECLAVVSVSQWLLAAAGILAGIPFTMAVSRLMSAVMVSELYSIPSFVDGGAVAKAAALTAVSVLIGNLAILGKIKKMIPAELLRERE